jgi:hypothetical protein
VSLCKRSRVAIVTALFQLAAPFYADLEPAQAEPVEAGFDRLNLRSRTQSSYSNALEENAQFRHS